MSPAQSKARHYSKKLSLGFALVALGLLLTPVGALAAYRDTVAATPGLIAQWRLGDASGTIATDSTGLQDGSYVGSPTLGAAGALADDTSTAMTIGTAGQAFTAPDRTEYANAKTTELWVRLSSYGDTTHYRAMASKGYETNERNWLVALGSGATGQLTYGFGSGGTAVGRRSVATLALNTWYLIDLVHPTGKIQLYVDGALDSELTTSVTPSAGTDPVIVGDDGQTGDFANARYDELALYDRALTATEIAAHYAAGTDPTAICDKVASPSGNNTNAGTAAHPYKTSTKLASSLTAGQTGCLRTGSYSANKLTLEADGITLETYPGDARATLAGAVWLKSDDVTVQELTLDGATTAESTSVTINGARDVVRYDDITSEFTSICINPTEWEGLNATAYVIERNRVHDCGETGTNKAHGVYLGGKDGLVRDNAIFDNTDRGVQMYPDADGNVVEDNTIDGNGEGVNFGGDVFTASDDNLVRDNVVTNATDRWLVEVYWDGPAGTGNAVSDNCLYATNATSYYNTNDGIDAAGAFTPTGSIAGDPLYTNRSAKDFRLTSSSACLGKGAPRDVAAP